MTNTEAERDPQNTLIPKNCSPKSAQYLSSYLGWLVRYQHALSSCDGVFYILGVAVPFYSNQMTRRGNLSCRTEKDKIVSSTPSKRKERKRKKSKKKKKRKRKLHGQNIGG